MVRLESLKQLRLGFTVLPITFEKRKCISTSIQRLGSWRQRSYSTSRAAPPINDNAQAPSQAAAVAAATAEALAAAGALAQGSSSCSSVVGPGSSSYPCSSRCSCCNSAPWGDGCIQCVGNLQEEQISRNLLREMSILHTYMLLLPCIVYCDPMHRVL